MTLDATGLSVPSLADTIEFIKESIISDIGAQVQLGPDSATGRLVTIFSSQTSQSNELLRGLYDAMNPDQAEQAFLDLICALNLVTRDPAVPSFGVLTITGDPATVIPSGSIYRVLDGAKFLTIDEVVIPGGGSVDVTVVSETAGAIVAGADSITEPVTIIAGVASVTNVEAVEVGRGIELDAALRQRREASLQRPGGRTAGSMRAALLALDTVTQSIVLSNDTDFVDALGLPAHSFRAIIWPAQADNDPVWFAIWQTRPATSLSDGDIDGTVTDSQGVSQPNAYSLADEQVLYVDVSVTTDAQTYGGDAAVKAAVIAWGAGNDFLAEITSADLPIGEDVLIHEIGASVSDLVTGIITIVVTVKVGSSPGSGDTSNIPVDLDQIATVDDANVEVDSS